MSSAKRRQARVQGGWAAPSKNTATTARSDAHKTPMPSAPGWLAKNADPSPPAKFIYEEPEEALKQPPKVKVIDKSGVYDLSETENGVSRVRLFPNFIDAKEAKWYYEHLFQEIPWKQLSDERDGQTYLHPRLVSWFGDYPYAYSGISHPANTQWTPCLRKVKDMLEDNLGLKFNSMLANLYRDGHDMVSWHSDDEPTLHKLPTIASLSFGDTRMFEFRKKPPPGSDPTDYTYMQHIKMPLSEGTLLIMEGATQDDWQHRLPKEYHDRSPRINLTFRVIYPD